MFGTTLKIDLSLLRKLCHLLEKPEQSKQEMTFGFICVLVRKRYIDDLDIRTWREVRRLSSSKRTICVPLSQKTAK